MTSTRAKRSPHLRATIDDLKSQYDRGFLTVRGYIYMYLLAARKKGWKLRTTVTNFCKNLGISRTAFYRAIADLRADIDLRFHFEIHGEIEMWVDSDDLKVSQIGDSSSQIGDSSSQIGDSSSQIGDEKTSNPLSDEESKPSSDLLQLNTTLSQFPAKPPAVERENFMNFENAKDQTPYLQDDYLENPQPKISSQSSPQIKVEHEDPIQVPQPPDSAEFLNFVLQSEVMTLPNPPESETGRKRLARTFIARDQDGDLVRAFEKWQRQQAELEVRRAASQAEALGSPPQQRTLGSELKRLQELFNCKVRAVQDTVIARAKALRFLITESGLELPPHLDPSMPLATWEALPCL